MKGKGEFLLLIIELCVALFLCLGLSVANHFLGLGLSMFQVLFPFNATVFSFVLLGLILGFLSLVNREK
jgi:hypothetical protein